MSLFTSEEFQQKNKLPLVDAESFYYPNFLSATKAHHYFNVLKEETLWQQDDIKIFGKTYKQPRLTALYGEQDKKYGYSNIVMNPHPFTPLLLALKNAVENVAGATFNVV